MFSSRHRAAGAAALMLVAAACKDTVSTGPVQIFNPTGATASLSGVDATFASAPFQSFLSFSGAGAAPAPGSPLAVFATIGQAVAPRLSARADVPAHQAALKDLARVMTSSQSIIPDSLKGTTWVWDTTQNKYVKSDSTGAPATGIRFELYAVDNTGHITHPLTQVGHLDYIDHSTAGSTTLQVVIASSTFTYVDETITGSGNASAFSVSATGYIQVPTHRLDFNISFTLASGTYAIQEQFSDFADQLGLTFDFSITAVSDTSVAATVSFSYSTGSQSINFNGGGTIGDSTQNVQGTVRVNGQVFAVITAVGPRSALPTITDAHGQPLSGDDAVLLYQMFVIVGRSLKWLNYLVGSFVSLTGIGVLLNV
ncbi:MAG TPA: hypothetical protein VNX15_01930 [Gemmatimonadales bacterium]|jgi:hypothetical protein|nr:hypothetical protein [Gemmatimonadales bacterium]